MPQRTRGAFDEEFGGMDWNNYIQKIKQLLDSKHLLPRQIIDIFISTTTEAVTKEVHFDNRKEILNVLGNYGGRELYLETVFAFF